MQDRVPDADETDPNTGIQFAFYYFCFWGFGLYSISLTGDSTGGVSFGISAKFVKSAY
jgi:hypothetical protein